MDIPGHICISAPPLTWQAGSGAVFTKGLKSPVLSLDLNRDFTSLDTSQDSCPSLRSESWSRSTRWWLPPRLTFEYQTGICFTNIRNNCYRNKIYVLTSLPKQIYLQPALCARIYCAVSFLLSPAWIPITGAPMNSYYCGGQFWAKWKQWSQTHWDLPPLSRKWVPRQWQSNIASLLGLCEVLSLLRSNDVILDLRLTSWLKSWLNPSLDHFPLWIRLDLDPDRVGPGSSLISSQDW